jgi:transposase
MYIRRTRTRNTITGEAYFTHRLVRSQRHGAKVRQVTLLNLGRYFAIDQKHWPTLCARIEQLLSSQQHLFALECPITVEREAQRIVAQLLARQSEVGPAAEQSKKATQPDVQAVEVDSLEMSRPRTVGVEHLGLWAMEQVGFPELLREAGLNGPQRAAAVGSIIGRMAAPGSELFTHGWLGDRSGLGELMDVDYERMSLMQLYRVSDLLLRHRQIIEQRLFSRVSGLFGFSCTVTLYDLTNTYFEGEALGNAKARRGHSKEKRTDCPLLTLGLVLDGSGFVRRSEVFAGNVAEVGTLEEMLRGLGAAAGALVVMDRGIASEANLSWLSGQGYRYLVVSRERRRQFDYDGATCIETASREKVHIQKVLSDDGQQVRLYCYSERRAKKEEGIVQRFAERFEAGLKKISDGLLRPRAMKDIDKIRERIGRLKEKSHGVGAHYHIEVIADETGKKARALQWERSPRQATMLSHPGVYCLRSNETGWDEQRLWRTYVMLTDLESVFRSLKSELGLRPVYHHKEVRGDGHLFITVLAYQFVQIIRRKLREKGITERWRSLRETLAGQCRVTATFRRADGRTLNVRKATNPEPGQRMIYQALGVPMTPGGVKKLVV